MNPVEHPRLHPPDPGKGAHEVLVVAQGDDAVQRAQPKRHVGPDRIVWLRFSAARCRQRIGHAGQASRCGSQLGQAARGQVPCLADPDAIGGAHLFPRAGQPGTGAAVAEGDGRPALLVVLHDVGSLVARMSVQERRLSPTHPGHRDRQRALPALWCGGADVGQRDLAQQESLIGLRAVAAAQHLGRHRAAVRGPNDVGAQGNRCPLEEVGERPECPVKGG